MKQTKEQFVGVSYDELLAENAKLVDVLHEVEAEAVHAYHCLQQDCVTTANSSEHFFKKWWHAECECDRLKAENAKLRELYSYFLRQKKLAGCFDCFGGNCEEWGKCHGDCVFESRARELGVEVNV